MATISQTGFTQDNPDAQLQVGGAPAVVQVGDINNTDTGGNLLNNEMADPTPPYATIWTDAYVHNRYEGDKRRYMMGITSPDGFQGKSVAAVQLASPTLLWVSDWTMQRTGEVPDIPDPNLVPDDWVLLDVHYDPAPLKLGRDGRTPIYRVSGTYVYGHLNPPENVHQAVLIACVPWIDQAGDGQAYPRVIPDSALSPSIIGGVSILEAQA